MSAVARLVGAALFAAILPAACGGSGVATAMDAGIVDAAAGDLAHCLIVDDAGVTHGCAAGSMGPGDRDDGGGAPPPPPPNVSPDAMNLPFGSMCLDNAQCTSSICFDYRVKGQFCTQLCNSDGDCPPASLGCSGQGVCRVGS